jgi:translation initiation factor IF-2
MAGPGKGGLPRQRPDTACAGTRGRSRTALASHGRRGRITARAIRARSRTPSAALGDVSGRAGPRRAGAASPDPLQPPAASNRPRPRMRTPPRRRARRAARPRRRPAFSPCGWGGRGLLRDAGPPRGCCSGGPPPARGCDSSELRAAERRQAGGSRSPPDRRGRDPAGGGRREGRAPHGVPRHGSSQAGGGVVRRPRTPPQTTRRPRSPLPARRVPGGPPWSGSGRPCAGGRRARRGSAASRSAGPSSTPCSPR